MNKSPAESKIFIIFWEKLESPLQLRVRNSFECNSNSDVIVSDVTTAPINCTMEQLVWICVFQFLRLICRRCCRFVLFCFCNTFTVNYSEDKRCFSQHDKNRQLISDNNEISKEKSEAKSANVSSSSSRQAGRKHKNKRIEQRTVVA